MPEAIEVRKVPIHSVSDASELAKLIDDGVMEASRVIAIIGKTEGNGGVNDYTRIIADRAFREALMAKGVDQDKVNVNGGAIALGHPVGMSGARIVLHLALELQRRGGGIGAAALCGGGGQGDALILRVPAS